MCSVCSERMMMEHEKNDCHSLAVKMKTLAIGLLRRITASTHEEGA